MEAWDEKTDEEVFENPHEQIGSQESYWRDIQIKRRLFIMQKLASESQIAAAESQIRAADATVKTAFWTKISAIAVGVTVFAAGIGVVLQAFADH